MWRRQMRFSMSSEENERAGHATNYKSPIFDCCCCCMACGTRCMTGWKLYGRTSCYMAVAGGRHGLWGKIFWSLTHQLPPLAPCMPHKNKKSKRILGNLAALYERPFAHFLGVEWWRRRRFRRRRRCMASSSSRMIFSGEIYPPFQDCHVILGNQTCICFAIGIEFILFRQVK